MEGGPPCVPPGSTCPAVLWILLAVSSFRLRGFYPLWLAFPDNSTTILQCATQSATPAVLLPPVWPLPVSLAATSGISFDFSSSAYLDVSVQRVFLSIPILFSIAYQSIAQAGSPIRKSTDIADICSSPWLIAACHVLLRLLMPRHSSYALLSLTFQFHDLSFSCFNYVSKFVVWLF